MRTVIVVPTYNESANLGEMVQRVRACAPEADILIVDDNSPDGTGAIADGLSAAWPGSVSVLHRESKQGLGPAYIAGFRWALERGYEAIVQMDADLSHDPSFIPKLLARLEQCDLVLGSRYVHGIAVVNWDFRRLLLSKLASAYVRFVTRMPFHDLTSGFKCWRRAALEAIPFDRAFAIGYLFLAETTYQAFRAGFRIQEEPIIFYERALGRSKMNWRIIVEALLGVIRMRLFTKRRRAAAAETPKASATASGER